MEKTTAPKAPKVTKASKTPKTTKATKAPKTPKVPKAAKTTKVIKQHYGTGRRKSSVARVFLRQNGSGKIMINKRSLEDYFERETAHMVVRQPLGAVDMLDKFDIYATVKGGGGTGQAGAVRLGITRALMAYDEEGTDGEGRAAGAAEPYRRILRRKGYVTRDARCVERKKIGLHKARKGTQYSKR